MELERVCSIQNITKLGLGIRKVLWKVMILSTGLWRHERYGMFIIIMYPTGLLISNLFLTPLLKLLLKNSKNFFLIVSCRKLL